MRLNRPEDMLKSHVNSSLNNNMAIKHMFLGKTRRVPKNWTRHMLFYVRIIFLVSNAFLRQKMSFK